MSTSNRSLPVVVSSAVEGGIGTGAIVVGIMAIVTLSSSVLTGIVVHRWCGRQREQELDSWKNRRQEERKGRIRAEVKLRTALKEIDRLQLIQMDESRRRSTDVVDDRVDTFAPSGEHDDHHDDKGSSRNDQDCAHTRQNNKDENMMILRTIGSIVSPYTKRMGTPRQPQLVPSSRGFVQLHKQQVSGASMMGIDQYSHIWIIFGFHANTNAGPMTTTTLSEAIAKPRPMTMRAKVRPPRGGGVKVGQLATRSPHRPNPLGLSLVKMDRWDESTLRLYISGLDLVHGTPVYDIKPCVPWDIPGHGPGMIYSSQQSQEVIEQVLRVPSWVTQEDSLSNVSFTTEAEDQLANFIHEGRLAPLYTIDNDGFTGAVQSLKELLACDPRSSHKGLKDNARGTVSSAKIKSPSASSPTRNAPDTTSSPYRLIFGQCEIEFVVTQQGAVVIRINAIDFSSECYVDGIPLISHQN